MSDGLMLHPCHLTFSYHQVKLKIRHNNYCTVLTQITKLTTSHIGLQCKTECMLKLDFPNVVALRHTFGGCPPMGYDPQIRTRPRFLYSAPSPKVHHSMFTRSDRVDKQTNKQTPLKTPNALRYATTFGNEQK